VRKNARFKIATGFAGTPFLPHALTKIGATNLFYRMLMHRKCPSWLYQVKMGATTMWERWDSMLPDGSINPGHMTSFNHYAFGAVGQWMHEIIGGLTTLVPGWKIFKVAPLPGGGLSYAKVKYDSPYGMIESEWELDGEILTLNVTVPLNTQAVIVVPGARAERKVGSGKYTFKTIYHSEPWPPLPINNAMAPGLDNEIE
jgi:alpha-L-rhamnosidase